MDNNKSLVIIKEYIKKMYNFVKKNKLLVCLIIVILLIVSGTYLYSRKYRTEKKLSYILNSLIYDKPREQMDFCGIDNNVPDIMKVNLEIDEEKQTIKFIPINLKFKINLYDLGFSSEYMIQFDDSKSETDENKKYGGKFKIEKVVSSDTIKIAEDTPIINKINEPEQATFASLNNNSIQELTDIEVTYFRPNSNVNAYKYRKLTDYYVASSHRSFLVGRQKADYCSVDMINRVLYLGARYIELEIFNKEIKDETVPVVTSGYNKGSMKLQLNYINLEECLDIIAKAAFSEVYLDNYDDPLFLFLDLKVGGNIKTLNQIANMIKAKLSDRLLPKKYLDTNMGAATLCELRKKIVIFCGGGGWRDSGLKDIINSSTDGPNPHLKRLTIHEIKNFKERSEPKASFRTANVQFKKGAINSIIQFNDPHIDLVDLGLLSTDNIIINGASNSNNNSGSLLFKVENVSRDKLTLDSSIKLDNEDSGSMISFNVYDKSFTGDHQDLIEYNKDNLTICIPDDRFYSTNYNYNEAMYKGCQFVAMNYQQPDVKMKEYFDYFSDVSFKFKPSSLTHIIKVPKVEGLEALAPKEKGKLNYTVDYTLFDLLNQEVTINSFTNDNINFGLKPDIETPNMLLDSDKDNITFEIVKGLDGGHDTVSFKNKKSEKYLKFNDYLCFLDFEDKPVAENSEDSLQDKINNINKRRMMSFIPLEPQFRPNTKKGHYNSFAVKMKKSLSGKNTTLPKPKPIDDGIYSIKKFGHGTNTITIKSPESNFDEIKNGRLVKIEGAYNANNNTGDDLYSIYNKSEYESSIIGKKEVSFQLQGFTVQSEEKVNSQIKDKDHDRAKITLYEIDTNYSPPKSDDLIDVLYYLKHTKGFNPKSQLFTKKTNLYDFKGILLKKSSSSSASSEDSSAISTTSYSVNDDLVAILTPKVRGNSGFKSLGDIFVRLGDLDYKYYGKDDSSVEITETDLNNVLVDTKQSLETLVINGSVSRPVNYELIYENSGHKSGDERTYYIKEQSFSIWKPIAPNGYTALGVVCQTSMRKPSKDAIYCVSNDYIKEEPYSNKDFYSLIYYHTSTPKPDGKLSKIELNIWTRGENDLIKNYGVIKQFQEFKLDDTKVDLSSEDLKEPNPFDNPRFVLNINPKDYKDRLYLDNKLENNKKDKQSSVFNIKPVPQIPEAGGQRYDKLLQIDDIDSKLISYTRADGGGTMCMGLSQAYLTDMYGETEGREKSLDNERENNLKAMNCGDPSDFSTNFRLYEDYSIRLANNNNYCVSHKPNSSDLPNTDINDPMNSLFISKCKPEFENQKFIAEGNKLKVFADGKPEMNACITHAPDNNLRLEKCGDEKMTALYLWKDKIYRDDYCFAEDANIRLKEASAIELCEDSSYFVLYLDGIVKVEEFCSKSKAENKFYEMKNDKDKKFNSGIVIAHKGEVILSTFYDNEVPSNFKNEIYNVTSKKGECYKCDRTSTMLCSNQIMQNSIYNSFNSFEEEQRLIKYCMKMKENTNFKCGRSNRQKFTHFPMPSDFCLSETKRIYFSINDISLSDGIKDYFKRKEKLTPPSENQFPVQNLLGEFYNEENYSVFIPGMLVKSQNDHQYKIIPDFKNGQKNDSPTPIPSVPISINKTSDFIVLDYKPNESMVKLGTKVLVNFEQFYYDSSNNSYINKDSVKYLGVVINMKDGLYQVMLSINSYESNRKNEPKIGKKYYNKNPIIECSLSELTLYKKADVCLQT